MRALRILRTVVRYEMGIWRSLAVWLLRLRSVPVGARPFGYARDVTPLLIVFIAVSAIELPVLHLLLPWPVVRLVVDILSVWGLLWMVGILAAVRVHPHAVSAAGIRIRNGFMLDVTIPWHAISSVRSRGRSVESSRSVHCAPAADGLVVSIPVAKQTTVDLGLRSPTALDLAQVGGALVVEVRLHADDPAALVAQIAQWTARSDGRTVST